MDEDDFMYVYDREFGCVHGGYDGWRHGCCDDMCIACNEPEWCENGIPCRHCNPFGDIR